MLDEILSQIRIIDLTQNVAGPFCTQILGDLGADIIKIERPGAGDDTRLWIPKVVGDQSSTFLALNRNKKSICVDTGVPDGQRVLRDLLKGADVIVHSMKPGSAESRGLGYDDVKADNPGIIYCSISAFGESGPLRPLPGYDPLIQAFAGIMSVTGNEGDEPVRVGVSLIDLGTGTWSALGILGALLRRANTGHGMQVSTSLLETGVSWMSIVVASYLASGKLPRKPGSAAPMSAPSELFRSKDGYIFVAAGNDRLFSRVCAALGRPDLAQDSRFATNTDRVANREYLHQALEACTLTRTARDAADALRAAGAPCSEMHDTSQMLMHEQINAVGIIGEVAIAGDAHHRVVETPLAANGQRSRNKRPPPLLGADTDSVLLGLGYDRAEVERLRWVGAVG